MLTPSSAVANGQCDRQGVGWEPEQSTSPSNPGIAPRVELRAAFYNRSRFLSARVYVVAGVRIVLLIANSGRNQHAGRSGSGSLDGWPLPDRPPRRAQNWRSARAAVRTGDAGGGTCISTCAQDARWGDPGLPARPAESGRCGGPGAPSSRSVAGGGVIVSLGTWDCSGPGPEPHERYGADSGGAAR